jgi:predicted nuclease of restriction endonuclease-like (RecB) superfamily
MTGITKTTEYKKFLREIKARIQTAQIKAAIKVNVELLRLYWDLAQMIVQKQKQSAWGDGLIAAVSKDLTREFPGMKGFSPTNLKYMRNWYLFYVNENSSQLVGKIETHTNRPQLVDDLRKNDFSPVISTIFQIPWGHNREIITKCKTVEEALFYADHTIEHNWSRAVLVHQIESGLIHREGKALNNFKAKLPQPQSDLANQTLKDPYCFDFLNLTRKHNEKELEDGLTEHLARFLLELGTGFSFIGRQYRLEIGGDEFFIDLLFYHVKLHCYVVVELKTTKFKPEFTGQLSFYISAVDGEIKTEIDNPTIGILICKSKNNTVVEYALNRVDSPIGVSEYTITKNLPDEFKSSLPTIEEIEAELEEVGGE